LRFAKRVDEAWPGSPWIVEALFPGAGAEKAGVRRGDRVLEIAGRRVGEDLAPFEAIERQRAGTKVPVLVARDGQKTRLVVELAPLLPPLPAQP
jgi:serine protease Do